MEGEDGVTAGEGKEGIDGPGINGPDIDGPGKFCGIDGGDGSVPEIGNRNNCCFQMLGVAY